MNLRLSGEICKSSQAESYNRYRHDENCDISQPDLLHARIVSGSFSVVKAWIGRVGCYSSVSRREAMQFSCNEDLHKIPSTNILYFDIDISGVIYEKENCTIGSGLSHDRPVRSRLRKGLINSSPGTCYHHTGYPGSGSTSSSS